MVGAQKGYASVDGKITPLDEATVPITDRGFLYGDSVYEVFRTYSGVPFFGAEHWQRLLRSAKLIRLRISESMQELHAEIALTTEVWHKNGGTGDVYVRYTYTRGGGPIDLYPASDLTPLRAIIVKAIPEWPAHHYSEGLTLAIPSVRRNPLNALSPRIKGGNYLNNVLGVLEAQELGAEDCLLLNEKQYLTEASNSNVLFVIDDAVQTPSAESGNLGGLTKGVVSELCASAGVSFGETLLSVDDIRSATECFVTSATREIVPVKSLRLEGGTLLTYPVGGGDMTRMLSSSYKDYVNRYRQENIDSRLFS